jgi:hypothetical protein
MKRVTNTQPPPRAVRTPPDRYLPPPGNSLPTHHLEGCRNTRRPFYALPHPPEILTFPSLHRADPAPRRSQQKSTFPASPGCTPSAPLLHPPAPPLTFTATLASNNPPPLGAGGDRHRRQKPLRWAYDAPGMAEATAAPVDTPSSRPSVGRSPSGCFRPRPLVKRRFRFHRERHLRTHPRSPSGDSREGGRGGRGV